MMRTDENTKEAKKATMSVSLTEIYSFVVLELGMQQFIALKFSGGTLMVYDGLNFMLLHGYFLIPLLYKTK